MFRVQGSGFRTQGSGLRVQGSEFRVQGSGSPKQAAKDVCLFLDDCVLGFGVWGVSVSHVLCGLAVHAHDPRFRRNFPAEVPAEKFSGRTIFIAG